ncbi:hypothetical protein [Lentzea sp. CA-135723]|uniref:hypothetical protein n=1 Tax=Lentzea sp. CA-135723 TaxID=3239950 RepID=UPI003D922C29
MIRERLFGRSARLRISRRTWRRLVQGLGERAGGRREAGAFLLGNRESGPRTVRRVVFYDDLDPNSLTGGISFGFEGFPRLWELCDRERLHVIGDVHTHFNDHVAQSHTDATNPMIARKGHVALIVPDLAARSLRAKEVGVHRYLGDEGWSSSMGKDAKASLYIGWWA